MEKVTHHKFDEMDTDQDEESSDDDDQDIPMWEF